MTRIENFERIITLVNDEEIINFCENEIAKIKASNERKKSATSAKKIAENEPILAKISEFLTGRDEPVLASEIANYCGVTTQKIQGVIKALNVEISDVKVPKAGIRKAYKLV